MTSWRTKAFRQSWLTKKYLK